MEKKGNKVTLAYANIVSLGVIKIGYNFIFDSLEVCVLQYSNFTFFFKASKLSKNM